MVDLFVLHFFCPLKFCVLIFALLIKQDLETSFKFNTKAYLGIYSSVHINESKVIWWKHFVDFLGKYLG